MTQDSFKSFLPFRRDLQTPCLLFCKWAQCGHCHDRNDGNDGHNRNDCHYGH